MLMSGVNDLRTPMGQTEEFYEALNHPTDTGSRRSAAPAPTPP